MGITADAIRHTLSIASVPSRRRRGLLRRLPVALLMVSTLCAAGSAQLDADFTVSMTQGTIPLQVSFSDTTTGGPVVAWIWDFGDASSSNLQHPTHTYSTAGTFTVSLTTIGGGLQSDTETKVDLIEAGLEPLTADFSADTQSGINPLQVNFTDLSFGTTVTSWSWSFGDGGTSTAQHPTHTYTLPGSHDVTLQVWALGQNTSQTKTGFITVAPAPIVVDFMPSVTLGASPLQVEFTDTTQGAALTAWSWDFGDGTTSTNQNPSHEYHVAETTSFDVSLTVWAGEQQESVTEVGLVTAEAGEFGPPTTIVTLTAGPSAIVSTDLDGDGDADVALSESVAGIIQWHANLDGLGSFGLPQTVDGQANSPTSLASADIDGDGDKDLVCSLLGDGQIAWYENSDGSGTFGPPRIAVSVANGPASVEPADLDGDGDLDVAFAMRTANKLAWSPNTNGLGTFGGKQIITTLTQDPRSIHAADLDADGDLDLLSASYDDWRTVSWQNIDGLGNFTAWKALDLGAPNPRLVDTADIDGDGDLDAVSLFSSGQIAYYINTDGLGDFGARRVINPASAVNVGRFEPCDLDGDGDIDVVATRSSSVGGGVEWYENLQNTGVFAGAQVISSALAFGGALDVADLDGDGDIDPVIGSSGLTSWHESALATPDWPFIAGGTWGANGMPLLQGNGALSAGSTVSLELSNALGGGSTTMVMGLSLLSAPFKGGVLVPNPDVLLPGLAIDSSGQQSINATWPAGIPAGVPIWFQHWVSDPAGPAGFAASNGIQGTTAL